MGRRGKLKATVLTLLLLGVVSGGGNSVWHAGASSMQKKSSGKRAQERAKVLYSYNCALCHGEDGRAQTSMGRTFAAPNLTDAAWWKKTRPTNKRLSDSIRHGRGHMPAFGRQLSKSEIAALVVFVRTFDGR